MTPTDPPERPIPPDRWARIDDVLGEALTREGKERAAFLDRVCAGDSELRRKLDSLLAAHQRAGSFIELPARERAAEASAAEAGTLVGRALGHYRVLERVGAGGMGVVYRAVDERLGRPAAIKVLSSARQPDATQKKRFVQEAQAASALNHPNIVTVYEIETEGDVEFIAMEYVAGKTLHERIASRGLPLTEALRYLGQVADALSASHAAGIVHRDLKPGNVMVTDSGQVKLLDFGLAKLTEPAVSGEAATAVTRSVLTEAGAVLGTVAYMSPEQARGETVDRRTDVWAFGCVLFEALSGKRAFVGGSASETLAKILETEPDWNALPASTPASIRRLIKLCLRKEVHRRLRHIDPVQLETTEEPAFPPPRAAASRISWAIAAVCLLVAVGAAIGWFWRSASVPARVAFVVEGDGGEALRYVSVSPDGNWLGMVVMGVDGRSRVQVRTLANLKSRVLDATEDAQGIFWSPDSRWIGFRSQSHLKKVDIYGGPAITLCEAPQTGTGTWSSRNLIVFPGPGGLYQVPAAGGSSSLVTRVDASAGERSHNSPVFLRDGRTFLYSARGQGSRENPDLPTSGIFAHSLDSAPRETQRKPVGQGGFLSYAPGEGTRGHLLFRDRDGVLMAQSFDEKALETLGDPFFVAPVAHLASASSNGALTYMVDGGLAEVQLEWWERTGKRLGAVESPAGWRSPSVSRKDSRIAVELNAGARVGSDIHVIEADRAVMMRITHSGAWALGPVWSPDGRDVMYGVTGSGGGLFRAPVAGTGQEEVVAQSDVIRIPTSWSRDGSNVLYTENPGGNADVWVLRVSSSLKSPAQKPVPFLATAFREHWARFSPDGEWVAYVSNESGGDEVFVESFPRGKGKIRISSGGGSEPLWRGDGGELFYLAPNGTVMAVPIRREPGIAASVPVPLFSVPLETSSPWATRYDVTEDGHRFLVAAVPPQRKPWRGIVVLNWLAGVASTNVSK